MPKRSLFVSLLLSGALSFPVAATEPSEIVLATVNDAKITQEDINNYVGVPPGAQVPNQQAVLEEMVNRELMVQEARERGLDKDPAFLNIIEKLKYNALFDFGMQKFLEKHPISDERLREEHKKVPPLKQYKVRHILVDNQQKAEQLIESIKQGQDFGQLAMQHSMDPMTRPRGGDLGWLTKELMFESVAKEVAAMNKGSFTTKPVQSQAGWHVVLLEDVREVPPLPFEAARVNLMAVVQNQMAAEHMAELKKPAKIEMSGKK